MAARSTCAQTINVKKLNFVKKLQYTTCDPTSQLYDKYKNFKNKIKNK